MGDYGWRLMPVLHSDPDPDPVTLDPDPARRQAAFIPISAAAEAALRTPVTKEPCLFRSQNVTQSDVID